MVLVDTSVWINHFRRANRDLITLLESALVLVHPFVIGELACGTLLRREEVLQWLRLLPGATLAEDSEVLELIEIEMLWGRGIGWVDAHLAAAARLGTDRLWTVDKTLARVCLHLGIAYDPSASTKSSLR
jgi:predicted nucleic acid-binding protein